MQKKRRSRASKRNRYRYEGNWGVILLVLVVVGLFSIGGLKNYGTSLLDSLNNKAEEQRLNNVIETVPQEDMRVTFIDIGQGNSTLIQTGNYNVLIDTGSHKEKEHLMSTLQEKGVEEIDYLIFSHPDEDHIGNGNSIIGNYPVKNVMYPVTDKDTKAWQITLDAIEEKSIPVSHPLAGTDFSVGGVKFKVITPATEDKERDANDSSIGFLISHGKKHIVVCGDAGEKSEREATKLSHSIEADILVCGHHGSASSTSNEFLTAVDPTYAIISVGKGNSYGHPHAETIAKLEDDDVQIYRTDISGNITATSNGETINFEFEK
ncbi:competence protein ComEC [Lachnospiraceae bacterium PF1-22]